MLLRVVDQIKSISCLQIVEHSKISIVVSTFAKMLLFYLFFIRSISMQFFFRISMELFESEHWS